MTIRRYARTLNEAFKHCDPSYAECFEIHVDIQNEWTIIKRALVITVFLIVVSVLW